MPRVEPIIASLGRQPLRHINGVGLNVMSTPQRKKNPRNSDGVPTVFVHGLAASSAFWLAAGAPILAGNGPLVFYDLRGHGKSESPNEGYSVSGMAEDLVGLLDNLELERVNLVTHSFGGMIGLLATLQQPERVASLVLADVRVRPLQDKITIPRKAIPAAMAKKLARAGIDLDQMRLDDDGVDYLRTVAKIQLAAGSEANDFLSELYQHPKLFRSQKTARKWIALAERASFIDDLQNGKSFAAADLKKLDLPMLILVGDKSSTLPSARAVRRIMPRARYLEIEGAGHFFPMTRPRAFLRPTYRFLRAVNRGIIDADH